jgi:hypothetical protein
MIALVRKILKLNKQKCKNKISIRYFFFKVLIFIAQIKILILNFNKKKTQKSFCKTLFFKRLERYEDFLIFLKVLKK